MGALQREPALSLRAQDRLGGKYVLIRRIAMGGMGQIWIARNEMTDAEVALKVLRGGLDKRIQVEPRFRHEARLGAMLTHRHIVRIFDLVEEPDGSLVLVMELLRGETLRRHLKHKSPLHAEEAVAIILPVLSALEHAHEMGIIHRDIKPANIFLAVDPDGHVTPKLLDFGIAKIPQYGVQTLDGRVLGTPRYMSPEQIRSESTIDGRSDIFSLGAVLVEMLTGNSPFAADTPSASLASVLETLLDPDPRIDPRLWLVLQRALAKRPYERFAHCAELAQALREAVGVSDHTLHASLRRSKPPPRISTTMRTALPGNGESIPNFGVHHPSDAPLPTGANRTPSIDDMDLESEDDDSSDYAMDVVSSQSESSVASEAISRSRPSSIPSRPKTHGMGAVGAIAQGADATVRDGAPSQSTRVSRGRSWVIGLGVIAILGLVFCGGLFFREAADRVTSTKSPAPSANATSKEIATPPTMAAETPSEPAAVDSASPPSATPGVPSASTGPARREPPGSSPARPAIPVIRNPPAGKKKVATTPGF